MQPFRKLNPTYAAFKYNLFSHAPLCYVPPTRHECAVYRAQLNSLTRCYYAMTRHSKKQMTHESIVHHPTAGIALSCGELAIILVRQRLRNNTVTSFEKKRNSTGKGST